MLTAGKRFCRSGQWSLIGTLIAVAIVLLLSALYLPKLLKPGSAGSSQQSAMQQANGTACTIYVTQFNDAVAEYKQDHGGQPPQSLAQLKTYGVTDDMINSPGCSFQMNPQTGAVTNAASPNAPAGATPATPGGITIPNMNGSGGGM